MGYNYGIPLQIIYLDCYFYTMILFNRAFTGSLLLACSVLFISSHAFALKESRLWLPKKHRSSMPQLIQAAKLAEQNPECVEVINGQMDRGRSKKAKSLVFRIDCRNRNGLSFSLIADAENEKGISRLMSGVRKKTQKVKPIEEARGWKICRIAIQKSLKKMINPVLLEVPTPKPYVTDVGESLFYVDFDAETVEGYPVYFVSVCKVFPSGRKSVELKPRKLVTKPKGFDIKRKAKTAEQKARGSENQDAETQQAAAQNNMPKTAKNKQSIEASNAKIQQKNATKQPVKQQFTDVDDGWEEVMETDSVTNTEVVAKPNLAPKQKITTDEDGWEVTEGE